MMVGEIGNEELILRLCLAAAFGAALGFDREMRGYAAGIRTHSIVALSAAVTSISALILYNSLLAEGSHADPLRVIQGLAQAIGFICAGLIFVRRGDVRNITTAANLWMAAALGISVGLGHYALVIIAAIIALLLLTVVRKLEHRFLRNEEDKN
ncbi:MgtC/SapB family protein [Rhizorhapis sp. SPR117]|uniref:MgtC/SapB family protein n=1 Tax=Rhizorhapis sp. SPR117 TaxID=2912611 RepID=UPI001F006770|nr:MgtC/SapB family protein [Rhizorhapis sp. SPR117]